MSMGWIKLYRSIQNCILWDDKPFDKCRAWIDLLLLANHEDKRILFNEKPITISRGQYLTSIRKLSDRWGWSYGKVERYIDMLESEGMVIKDSNKNRTLLTIVKYEVYQSDGTPMSEQTEQSQTNRRHSHGTVMDDKQELKNDKNDKNDKNEKNIRAVYYPDDEVLNQTFSEYVLMRKKLKKPFATDHAIELAINKLDKLSGGDSETAIAILNQSIENSWQGLFEVKNRPTAKTTSIYDAWKDA